MQKPLHPDGGKSPRIGVRLPRDQHERLVSAISQRDLTLSEFLRNATEAELEGLDAQIAEACAPPG